MAKVGSLNLIKQFSSAQGEDKQVCLLDRIYLLHCISNNSISQCCDLSALGLRLVQRIESAIQSRVDRSFQQEEKEMKSINSSAHLDG